MTRLALYLDDCATSRRLRALLEEAGHSVLTPAEAVPPLTGADDGLHFAYARTTGRIIVTFNARDFLSLHHATPDHPGVFVIYQDNDPSRDMTAADIVRAISNFSAIVATPAAGFWVLNRFRW